MLKIVYFILAYFVGTIMIGFIVAKRFGSIDIREHGSGNVGARNVGRLFGRKAFILTFLGDATKAVFIVLGAKWLGFSLEWQLVAWLGVLLGHIWPITLKFKGGKGVASFIGGFLAFNPLLFLYFGMIFLVFYLIIRSLTIAGIGAILLTPFLFILYYDTNLAFVIYISIVILIVFAHLGNLKKKILQRR